METRAQKGQQRRRSRTRPAARSRRGVALILVLTMLAILTSVAVEFVFSTRVNLKLAENLRDETRAYYLARSAVNLSRLLLHFQKQLDQVGGAAIGGLQNLLKTAGGGAAGPPTTPAGAPPAGTPGAPGAAGGSGSLGIRLWELVPINSNSFSTLLGTGLAEGVDRAALGADRDDPEKLKERQKEAESQRPPGAPPLEGGPLHSFGDFAGTYSAKITDENSRINVRGLANIGAIPRAAFIQLRAMMADTKYDFIFNEDDANRDRVRRDDVILALKDWLDEDESGSAIDPNSSGNPFVNGFSDENAAYDRYQPRYKAKNADADSLEELYMVRGVNDRFMAAFGDRLTIWPAKDSKLNINTSDPLQMVTNVMIVALHPEDYRLRDPLLLKTILQELQIKKTFSFFGLGVADFVSVLTQNGVQVRPEFTQQNSTNNFLSDQSDTFRISAVGKVGSVEKRVTAVVRYDELLGRLLYWKEE